MAHYTTQIEKLTKHNYEPWRLQMKAILVQSDEWEYVDGSNVKPEDAAAAAKWTKTDQKVMSRLILAMSFAVTDLVKNCETSQEIWLKLHEVFQSKRPARKAQLLKQLLFAKLEEGNSMSDFLTTFFNVVDKLTELDIRVQDDVLVVLLLYSIPDSYDSFRCAIEARDELPTPEALRLKLLDEAQVKVRKDNTKDDSCALYSKGFKTKAKFDVDKSTNNYSNSGYGKPRQIIRCNYCHKVGHKTPECWKRAAAKKNTVGNDRHNVAHMEASFLVTNVTNTTARNVEQALSCVERDDLWCVDSGATAHMCNDKSSFIDLKPVSNQRVKMAVHEVIDAQGLGTVCLNISNGKGMSKIYLHNTLYVPELRTNLLSVVKIMEKGYKVTFENNHFNVIRPDNQVVISGSRYNNLMYAADCRSQSNNKALLISEHNNIMLWHQRYGHLNVEDLKKLELHHMVYGMKLNPKEVMHFCDVCAENKQAVTPFPRDHHRRCSEILELVHSDICGPMRTTSNGGSRYFVTFIDEYSKWIQVYVLKTKAEMMNAFLKYKAVAENQTNRRIKCLRTDNGTEYCSANFERYLEEHGIRHERSSPYTPQQNGTAERMNRTLVEMARCMISQSKLSKAFWGEAIATAAYIRNRCPTRKLQDKTPFEIWYGQKPNVSPFKIFGCKAFALNKRPGRDKFDPKATECIFVGYSCEHKAYRLWNPLIRKIIITRDAKFCESYSKENGHGTINNDLDVVDIESEKTVPAITNPGISSNINLGNSEENSESDPDEDEPNQILSETPKRGPGRPRILRTGRVGRPKKLFAQAAQTAVEDLSQANHEVNLTNSVCQQLSFKEATSGPNSEEWKQAMQNEYDSLIRNNCWNLVKRPKHANIIGCRWVFKTKYNPDGTVDKYRARLVAKGYNQRQGIDYHETFAPVGRLSSLRILVALSVQNGLKLYHLDIVMAFINGKLNEEIYMDQAEGFVNLEKEDHVYKLNRSIYGLKQSGREWSETLRAQLQNLGYEPLKRDGCLYTKRDKSSMSIVLTYVDDLIIATNSARMFQDLKDGLGKVFQTKDLGALHYCLGIEFKYNEKDGSVSMNQGKYTQDILRRFNMQDAKPVATPLDANAKFVKGNDCGPDEKFDEKLYKSAVGSLMYLSVATRPDIAHAVSKLSQFNHAPTNQHWSGVKRVFRYLRGTENYGLLYQKSREALTGYVDADWGGDPDDRRSFTGYCFKMGNSLISWEARKQKSSAMSSTESEYMALSEAAKEVVYIRRLLSELGAVTEQNEASVMYCDNQGAIKLAKNPVFHSRTKHIEIRHHYAREVIVNGDMEVKYMPTEHMLADIFTKGLFKPAHNKCIRGMNLVPT